MGGKVRIIGIDPGLRLTGFGCVETPEPDPINAGRVPRRAASAFPSHHTTC